MLYAILIFLSMAVIFGVNLILNQTFFQMEIWYILVAVIVSTAMVIIVDGLFATIIRRLLPNKFFDYKSKIFKVGEKERLFYEKIGIKKWKDKVLELGVFTNFRKNKLEKPYDNEYVERFILEVNYGILIHIICAILGFSIIFIYPLKYFLCFGIPVAFVNAVLNIFPLFILRYNLPKLERLRVLNEKKEKIRQRKEFQKVS